MTVEQEAIYTRYKTDNDFKNECNLKTWAEKFAIDKLARKIIREGVQPDANT